MYMSFQLLNQLTSFHKIWYECWRQCQSGTFYIPAMSNMKMMGSQTCECQKWEEERLHIEKLSVQEIFLWGKEHNILYICIVCKRTWRTSSSSWLIWRVASTVFVFFKFSSSSVFKTSTCFLISLSSCSQPWLEHSKTISTSIFISHNATK